MNALTASHDAAVQMIDTSIVRVHQHGACIADNTEQLMGRSRGGLTTKIHVVVDAGGLPVRLALTAGEAHDNRLVLTLLSARRVGEHSSETEPQGADLLQPPPLSCTQFGRAVLQQHQAMSSCRHPI